jgi:hypothetical protein
MYIEMFINKINLPIFICSFAIGIFLVYVLGEDKKIIYIYPSPSNYNDIIFKDYANNCFQIKPQTVQCPAKKDNIKQIPIITK